MYSVWIWCVELGSCLHVFVVVRKLLLGLLSCDLVLAQKLQIWNYYICKTVDASCLHINIWSQVCFCSFGNNLMQFCRVLWNSNFFHPAPVFLNRESVDFLILMRGIVWYCMVLWNSMCFHVVYTREFVFMVGKCNVLEVVLFGALSFIWPFFSSRAYKRS